ncbi:MAG: hypothetical protein KJ018_07955 [Burkholderiales bacterium]|nr:hypothetical protein [Burkholderiales bacterium]GIK86052.1 MAG: hypothetical protein BroJett026_15330 [Betaproteobacteria bacterium]
MRPSLHRTAVRGRLAAAAALLAASAPLAAQNCVGFTDVPAASPFCQSVEWIRNRKVTVGCTATEYCPDLGVSRLQMAAFMTRLGAALTPLVINVAATSGALALGSTPVVCQTAAQAIEDFPRRALVDASLSGTAAAAVDIGVGGVYSTDGGANWLPLGAVQPAAHVPANQWGQASDVGVLDLAVGTSVRFGVQAARVGAGSTDLTDSRCQVRAAIGSRDGTSSPF